jgi:hypothetical protein
VRAGTAPPRSSHQTRYCCRASRRHADDVGDVMRRETHYPKSVARCVARVAQSRSRFFAELPQISKSHLIEPRWLPRQVCRSSAFARNFVVKQSIC